MWTRLLPLVLILAVSAWAGSGAVAARPPTPDPHPSTHGAVKYDGSSYWFNERDTATGEPIACRMSSWGEVECWFWWQLAGHCRAVAS
jgi:hypothetical protein